MKYILLGNIFFFFSLPIFSQPIVAVVNSDVCTGSTVKVPVTITTTSPTVLGSISLIIENLDPTILQFNAVTTINSLLTQGAGVVTHNYTNDKLSFAWFNISGTAFSGTTTLFEIEFTGLAAGNADLDFDLSVAGNNELSDNFGSVFQNTIFTGGTVTSSPVPTNVVISGNPMQVCEGTPITFTASSTGGTSYAFYINSTLKQAESPSATFTTSELDVGNSVWVVAFNDAGCSMASQPIIPTIFLNPNVSIGPDVTMCSDETATLSVPSTYSSYSWSNGGNTSSITVNTGGTYSVIVTDNNGCQGTDEAEVIINCFGVGGTLTYPNPNNTPLTNTMITLVDQSGNVVNLPVGSSGNPVTTDAQGNYAFSKIPIGNYRIIPSINKPFGGSNSNDAYAIYFHFLQWPGSVLTDPLLLNAANVTGNRGINVTDAIWVLLRAVGWINFYPVGNWTYDSNVLQITNSDETFNIRGICYGDIVTDYVPPTIKSSNPPSRIHLEAKDKITLSNVGQKIIIPLKMTEALDVHTITMALNYPSEYLEIENVALAEPLDEEYFYYTIKEGKIRVAWMSLTGLALKEMEPILNLTATVKAIPTNLSALRFSFGKESNLGNIKAQEIPNVILTMPEFTPSHITTNLQEFTVQLFPNPLRAYAQIHYNVPKEGNLNLQLFDQYGRLVKQLANGIIAAGTHQFDFDGKEFSDGVYILKAILETSTSSREQTLRIVILK